MSMTSEGLTVRKYPHAKAGPTDRELVRTLPGAPRLHKCRKDNVRMAEVYKMPGRGKLVTGAHAGPRRERMETAAAARREAPGLSYPELDSQRYLSGLKRGQAGPPRSGGPRAQVLEIPNGEPGEWGSVARALMRHGGTVTYSEFEEWARRFGFSEGSVRQLVSGLRCREQEARGPEVPATEEAEPC